MSEIMKKYKHGEFSNVADKTSSKEKIQSGMNKKYSHGEFSDAGGKAANAKPEAFASKKFKQGELGGASDKPGKKNKGQGLKAMGSDNNTLSVSY